MFNELFKTKPIEVKAEQPQQQKNWILLFEDKNIIREKDYFYFICFKAGHLQAFKTPVKRGRHKKIKDSKELCYLP